MIFMKFYAVQNRKVKKGKCIIYTGLYNNDTEELAEFCFLFQNIL